MKISCHGFQPIGPQGVKVGRTRTPPPKIDYALLLRNNVVGCSTVMLHRSLISSGFPAPPHEDYRLWLQLTKDHDILGLPETLSLYRVGHASASSNKLRSAINRLKILNNEPLPFYQKPQLFLYYLYSGLQKHLGCQNIR
jgi:teichuronic acid biosynthesis glycosyltransferase TuaG